MILRLREDKDEGSRCPFCNQLIKAPDSIKTEGSEFIGGRCDCGTVYACDPTGHNVGEAYLDALTYACGDDWDVFNSLSPDADYREAVFNYDLKTNRSWNVKDIRRDYSGKIVFVKMLKNDK